MTDYRSLLGKKVGARVICDVTCKCGHGIRDHRVVNVDAKARLIKMGRQPGKAGAVGQVFKDMIKNPGDYKEYTDPGMCMLCACNEFRFRRYHYKKGSSK